MLGLSNFPFYLNIFYTILSKALLKRRPSHEQKDFYDIIPDMKEYRSYGQKLELYTAVPPEGPTPSFSNDVQLLVKEIREMYDSPEVAI